ncbi:20767_t:CDS:2, partial [Gigaspora margarita]
QTLATIKQSQQQSLFTPEMTLLVPSNAIIGIVNTLAKAKDWKDFLKLPYDTYWSYQRNLCDRLNACCQKGKYASEQEQEIVQKVIKK